MFGNKTRITKKYREMKKINEKKKEEWSNEKWERIKGEKTLIMVGEKREEK